MVDTSITIRTVDDVSKLTPEQARAVLATIEAEAEAQRYRQDPVAFVRERLGGITWADVLPQDPEEVKKVISEYVAWFDAQGFAEDYIAHFRDATTIPDRQAEILEAFRDHPQVVVASANSIGKTFIASDALIWFFETQPLDVVALSTAPNKRQVDELLWRYIRAKYAALENSRGRMMPKASKIEIDEKSFAAGYTAENDDNFQGYHSRSICLVLDEAVGVHPSIWEAAQSILTGENARLLAIGNPTDLSGDFYEAFHGRSANWYSMHISAFDHPNVILGRSVIPGAVTRENILLHRGNWGEGSPAWDSRVLGRFPEQSDKQLISAAWLTAARKLDFSSRPARTCGRCAWCVRNQNPTEATTDVAVGSSKIVKPSGCMKPPAPVKVAGLDVASEGDDRGVLTLVTDGVVESIETWLKHDTTHYANVAEQAIQAGYVVKVDSTGVGVGVTDTLKARGYKPGVHYHAVNFGAAAVNKDRYPRVKDEMWGNLADLLRNGEVSLSELPEHVYRDLWADLVSVQRKENVAGKIETESKKDRRARGVRSPDLGDSLALALYHPPKRGIYVGTV